MNAETPMLDMAECGQFLAFWMEVTGVAHVTLVAIVPDGKTTTLTWGRGDERTLPWIETMQNNGCNIYFQPNETHPGCTRKPAKAEMVAILCRHADMDPVLPEFTLEEERDRLRQLAEFLRDDPQAFPADGADRFRRRHPGVVGV